MRFVQITFRLDPLAGLEVVMVDKVCDRGLITPRFVDVSHNYFIITYDLQDPFINRQINFITDNNKATIDSIKFRNGY